MQSLCNMLLIQTKYLICFGSQVQLELWMELEVQHHSLTASLPTLLSSLPSLQRRERGHLLCPRLFGWLQVVGLLIAGRLDKGIDYYQLLLNAPLLGECTCTLVVWLLTGQVGEESEANVRIIVDLAISLLIHQGS